MAQELLSSSKKNEQEGNYPWLQTNLSQGLEGEGWWPLRRGQQAGRLQHPWGRGAPGGHQSDPRDHTERAHPFRPEHGQW